MTRPAAASTRFWNVLPRATRAHLDLLISPLLEIRPRPLTVDSGAIQAAIFTSANGVASGPAPSRDALPAPRAYCVGTRTTALARDRGWDAECAGQTAQELLQWLHQHNVQGPLVHFHGRHTRGDIAGRLRSAGIMCEGHVVYDQILQPLTDAAQSSLKSGKRHLVPLFSPRTAQQFAYECGSAENIFFIAMSDAVAEPLQSLNYMEMRVSQAPDANAMMDSVRVAAGRLAQLEAEDRAQ